MLRQTTGAARQAGTDCKTPPCLDGQGACHSGGGAQSPRREGGMLGREEIEEIAPAVQQAQAAGLSVVGPYPADSVFIERLQGSLMRCWRSIMTRDISRSKCQF